MFRFVLALLSLAFFAGSTPADVPRTLSYQGELTDANGDPVTGNLNVTFRIYDDFAAGSLVWAETQSVDFSDGGLFDVVLGTINALSVGFDAPYWLTIEVEGDTEMTPRVPLTAAPYSLNVRDGAIGPSKIQDGSVVRSINGLTDTLSLVAGSNVTISPSGSTLEISATGGSSGPDGDWTIDGSNMSSAVSGNVGIGTTSPSAPLEVVGRLELSGSGSRLEMRDGSDQLNVVLDGLESGGGGYLNLYNSLGARTIELDGDEAGTVGMLRLYTGNGTPALELEGQQSGSSTDGGILRVFDDVGNTTGTWDGKQGNGGSVVRLFDEAGTNTIYIDGNEGDVGAIVNLYNDAGVRSLELDSHEGSGDGVLRVYDATGMKTVEMTGDQGGNGNVNIYNNSGVKTVELDAREGDGAGQIELFDATGALAIEIDAQKDGTSFMSVGVLQINGGADLAETFDIAEDRTGTSEPPEPGMVVSIDPSAVGGLRISDRAYDRRVAGVISGAGGVRPGMMMGQRGSVADGEHPVALTGRVYVWADASGGAIEPGDLLTTSDTPGHAMKVADHSRAPGAVLGKAMTALDRGRGLVLLLVSLQ